MVYIFLTVMILLNVVALSKKRSRQNYLSKSRYVESCETGIKEVYKQLSIIPSDKRQTLFNISTGITVIFNGTLAIVSVCIIQNILLLPFAVLLVIADLYECQMVMLLAEKKLTGAQGTFLHCILIYRRLLFIALTLGIALTIF